MTGCWTHNNHCTVPGIECTSSPDVGHDPGIWLLGHCFKPESSSHPVRYFGAVRRRGVCEVVPEHQLDDSDGHLLPATRGILCRADVQQQAVRRSADASHSDPRTGRSSNETRVTGVSPRLFARPVIGDWCTGAMSLYNQFHSQIKDVTNGNDLNTFHVVKAHYRPSRQKSDDITGANEIKTGNVSEVTHKISGQMRC